MSEKDPLVIITGPTSVGKSELSVMLAKKCSGEIISADSMQVYRKMNIGTAKITDKEMQGVPHHLIDCFPPEYPFNVSEFQFMAKKAVNDILKHSHLPIVAGGTGFYIQSLVYDIDFKEEKDDGYRQKLEAIALTTVGTEKLYKELCIIDPESADTIHVKNVKKIIRALTYYHYHNEPISKHNKEEREKTMAYNTAYFVLTMDRTKLYDRIEKRVDKMISNGLVEEVQILLNSGLPENSVSMQGIGYKEIASYISGKTTLENAVYEIKENTRHFAKRQLTWFRREKDVIWINKDDYKSDQEILDFMINTMKNKSVII